MFTHWIQLTSFCTTTSWDVMRECVAAGNTWVENLFRKCHTKSAPSSWWTHVSPGCDRWGCACWSGIYCNKDNWVPQVSLWRSHRRRFSASALNASPSFSPDADDSFWCVGWDNISSWTVDHSKCIWTCRLRRVSGVLRACDLSCCASWWRS